MEKYGCKLIADCTKTNFADRLTDRSTQMRRDTSPDEKVSSVQHKASRFIMCLITRAIVHTTYSLLSTYYYKNCIVLYGLC